MRPVPATPANRCLALCRSRAGQNRATEATPRISQGIHARRNLGFTAKGDAPVPSYAQKMGNRFCPTTRHQLPGHHHTVIPQWVLHYCLSCLHWKPRDARHYSSRQGAAFRGSHVILPEDGCLALCRSWAGQHEVAVTASRNSQGSFMPG